MRLNNKIALITGAGSGIGKATAIRFAAEGAAVAVSDLSRTAAQKTVSKIEKLDGRAITISGDVSIGVDAESMVTSTVDVFDRLDILINSAGVTARNALSPESDPEEIWDRVLEVNLKGTYLISSHAVKVMQKGNGGSIVNLSSIMGLVGYPAGLGGGFNPYPPSKGGVIQLTKNMAIDFAKDNIRVNCLCPGFVETDLTKSLTKDPKTRESLENRHPIGRLGKPEEIASAALYLSSDEASYITGVSLAIDGGYTAQ